MLNKILKIFSDELDSITLEKVEDFIELEMNSNSFQKELESYSSKLDDDEDKKRNEKIVTLILLGMGRNRTIEVLKDYEITRTIFEKVRDKCILNLSDRKINNEKQITAFRWESKTRAKRIASLNKVNWKEIKEKYSLGESPIHLGKLHKVSPHLISEQLREEGLFDEFRSTLTKNKIAEDNIDNIDDEFIIKLVKDNPLDSKPLLWEKAKLKYPWLLRSQMYDKMEKLGIMRTQEEVNAIRSIKSKTETNDAYMIKLNGYKAVKHTFGSVENLVNKYMNNSLGSFNKIADFVNNTIEFEYEISPKQISKIITNHSSYVRKTSLGQKQLYEFVRKTFKNFKVIEEFSWDNDNSNKKIDVYIPEIKVGFEFNGEYWHSDVVINYNYGKTAKEFHKERADELSKIGIKLLYIWENDWNYNYEEIEKEIQKENWKALILNKYDNVNKRSDSYFSPDKTPSLLRNQIIRFLKENKIEFIKENNSHLIEITKENIVINVPNYSFLSNQKESLNLQKHYEKEGIELLTFLPWRNIYKIKEFLTYRLKLKTVVKVAARKCDLIVNDGITKEQRHFFEKNHLLGYNNFKNVDKTILLSKDGEIVIAALFVKKLNSNTSELKRLVSSYGVSVQGGASRLLKEYERQSPEVSEIITFSDSDLGFGNVYEVLGFTQIERSKEQLTWFNESLDMKFSNISLIQVGADRLLRSIPNYEKVGIGKDLPSNQEIVETYGFMPIYDSGYKKWKLTITND